MHSKPIHAVNPTLPAPVQRAVGGRLPGSIPKHSAKSRYAEQRYQSWRAGLIGFCAGVAFWHFVGFWNFVGEAVLVSEGASGLSEKTVPVIASGIVTGTTGSLATMRCQNFWRHPTTGQTIAEPCGEDWIEPVAVSDTEPRFRRTDRLHSAGVQATFAN